MRGFMRKFPCTVGLGGVAITAKGIDMGGDDYVITKNSKHTDAHAAAHDLDAQVTDLRTMAIECRSSVKFDLTHYEKMARAYGNLGAEGAQTHAVAEAEARRLFELLEKIDALAPTTPNLELRRGRSNG